MNGRLSNFLRNGVPVQFSLASWLQMKQLVEDNILKFPVPPRKDTTKKRKRVTAGGRLLTHQVLQEIQNGTVCPGVGTRNKQENLPSGSANGIAV